MSRDLRSEARPRSLVPESTISVVVSVYGNYAQGEVLRAVLTRWLAQTADVEVVLSEQTAGSPRWRGLVRELGIVHTLSRPDRGGDRTVHDIGRPRNAGLRVARGEYLYFTDADVYPLGPDYLMRLRASALETPGIIQYRPHMFRLAAESTAAFLDYVSRCTDTVGLPKEDGCLCEFHEGNLALLPEKRRRQSGWVYLCTPEEWSRLNDTDFDEDFELELIMKSETHWGGTFLPRKAALEVGGYPEGYFGWGCEDDDFHAKLACRYALEPMTAREVVHFEHPRPYNDELFARNLRRLRERGRAGAEAMIAADRAVLARGDDASRARTRGTGPAADRAN